MLYNAFDDKTEALITPESFYGKQKKICDICIGTFSHHVVEWALQKLTCTQAAQIAGVNGNRPVWLTEYRGKKLAFYMTGVGSAITGSDLEDVHWLTGAGKFILFGSCGSLDQSLTAGKLIVPTHAFRDEGFSWHYMPPSDYVVMKNAERVKTLLQELGVPCVEGRTWTTDAIYRETRGKMEKRKAEGGIAVEMECAGAQAVCDFRGFELYYFLFSSDLLDAEEWEARTLGGEEEHNHQFTSFHIALEMALRL